MIPRPTYNIICWPGLARQVLNTRGKPQNHSNSLIVLDCSNYGTSYIIIINVGCVFSDDNRF